jgi:polysaccharide export outer membrane protein
LLLVVGVLLLSSCIPTKDLIYLQKDSSQQEDFIAAVETKPYRLQINDV